MKSVFHLATCSTNQRILKELQPEKKGFTMREIKTEPMTAEEVDHMAELAGSYEALFSRKAMKFRSMGLHEQQLGEKDYRRLILEEYTFLKRPVIVNGKQIFVGNSKAVVAAAADSI